MYFCEKKNSSKQARDKEERREDEKFLLVNDVWRKAQR